METTIRGFELIKFQDSYGAKCSLQKSSSAEVDKIWLGIDEPEIKVMTTKQGWQDINLAHLIGVPEKDLLVSSRMHLSQDDVKKILPALIHFAEFGDVAESLQGLGRGKQINLTKNLLKLLFPDVMLKVEGRIGDIK